MLGEYRLRNDIDQTVCNLTKDLREQYPPELNQNKFSDLNERQSIIITKIENIINNLVKDLAENNKPISLTRHKKCWDNCVFNNKLHMKPKEECVTIQIKLCRNNVIKYSLICFLLAKIYVLLKTGETCNKRELYYRNIDILESQSLTDSALHDITCLLEAPLYDLNIHTTSKGLIYGPVILRTSSKETDCVSEGGTLIPADVSEIIEIKTEAKFILLLEKDTIFHRLVDDEVMNNLPPCIFVTGKGVPDISTRILLKKMWDVLRIPILALVDPDPWGIEIMCIYRFGSLAMSHQVDQLAVPSVRWLGVFPSEVRNLVPSSTCAKLSELTRADRTKLTELQRRPYALTIPRLMNELQNMTDKAEIETIDDPEGFLAHRYIPCHIAEGNFI